MENVYVISEISKLLEKNIRKLLKVEFDIAPEEVGLGIPGENSRFSLCIYLFDIKRNLEVISEYVAVGTDRLRYPSAFYDLYYMLVPYSDGDERYRMEEELMFADVLLSGLADIDFLEEGQAALTFCNMDFDEKTKVWNALSQPMRPALYCKAGPVEVKSGRMKEITRVRDVGMHFREKEEE